MMSLSIKLTLLVLMLPISVLLLFDLAIFYFYESSVEVSSLIATVVVFLLVWERLRDSLSKKLEYFHKNYLSDLYEQFKMGIFHFWQPTVERIKPNLKRYGRFLGISLCPRKLPDKVEWFLYFYEEFKVRLLKIDEIGEKSFEKGIFDEYIWHHVLGIKILVGSYLTNHLNTPKFNLHEETADAVKKAQGKLLSETKEYLKELEEMKKEILETFEDFFKSNNLEIPELPYEL